MLTRGYRSRLSGGWFSLPEDVMVAEPAQECGGSRVRNDARLMNGRCG